MSNYQIIATTNDYVASRDAKFNGKTKVVLHTGLSYEDAQSIMDDMLAKDWPSATYITTEDQYIREYLRPIVQDDANDIGMDVDTYIDQDLEELTVRLFEPRSNKMFSTYKGPGRYDWEDGGGTLIKLDTDTQYEHDMRYYSIEKEGGEQ